MPECNKCGKAMYSATVQPCFKCRTFEAFSRGSNVHYADEPMTATSLLAKQEEFAKQVNEEVRKKMHDIPISPVCGFVDCDKGRDNGFLFCKEHMEYWNKRTRLDSIAC